VRHLGGDLGQDNRSVLVDGLGRALEEIQRLQRAGIVGGPALSDDVAPAQEAETRDRQA
jgi:hypothetical protein